MSIAIKLAERGLLPDSLIRVGIRRLLAERLQAIRRADRSDADWIQKLEATPVAVDTDAAFATSFMDTR